jgi:hypothetical protein
VSSSSDLCAVPSQHLKRDPSICSYSSRHPFGLETHKPLKWTDAGEKSASRKQPFASLSGNLAPTESRGDSGQNCV